VGSAAVPFLPTGSGRFVAGWYDFRGGRAYVSRGTGTSIAPARFTCRPELPIYTLRQG
jgi:predicted MPP superfamily phosphohydrolase